jgi:hypothetical protein
MGAEHLLVRSAGADQPRIELLTRAIAKRGVPVVVGPGLGGYPSHSQEAGAAALVLLFGRMHNPHDLGYSVGNFRSDGRAIAVRLDPDGAVPQDLSDLPAFDLSSWRGGSSATLDALIENLSELWQQRDAPPPPWGTLAEMAQSAQHGVTELRSLTDDLRPLKGVLAGRSSEAQLVGDTLHEIAATYRVVKLAVTNFVAHGLGQKGIDGEGYASLRHGVLRQAINSGRAHCGRIGTRYEMVGGLRDHIEGRVSADTLARLDEAFQTLANSDGDVFEAMEHLGDALTRESGAIVRLLLAGREDLARQHIADAYTALEPLEEALDDSLAALQELEASLGYAEPTSQDGGTITHYTETNIHTTITGSITGSQLAIGQVERVHQEVAAAPIGGELKELLAQLATATKELVDRLPPEDAELAADDLDRLVAEARAERPRPAFIRRATDGLLNAAKKVADVGLPVIEFVTKIVAVLPA